MYNIAHTSILTRIYEMQILIQIPYFIDFAINCHNTIPLLCIFARSLSWDTVTPKEVFALGGGGGVLHIFSIYICDARMPLFLTIFLSLASSKMAIYSQVGPIKLHKFSR